MKSHFIKEYSRELLPAEMLKAVHPYESRFQKQFSHFFYFSKEDFDILHEGLVSGTPLPAGINVASENDKSIADEMELFFSMANTENVSDDQRKRYFESLISVYRKLVCQPAALAGKSTTLCVGVEREGRIIANALNLLPENRSFMPHAKRIAYQNGLLVGVNYHSIPEGDFDKCVIIDGAIASGATVMSNIWLLKNKVRSFHVYSVHSPIQGLRAIKSFAYHHNFSVTIDVGNVTDGMNDKFYAVDSSGKNLILGDIGDMISSVAES